MGVTRMNVFYVPDVNSKRDQRESYLPQTDIYANSSHSYSLLSASCLANRTQLLV